MATKAAYPHSPRLPSLPSDRDTPESSPCPDSASPDSPRQYRSSDQDFVVDHDPRPQSPASQPDHQSSPRGSLSNSASPSYTRDRSPSPASPGRSPSPHDSDSSGHEDRRDRLDRHDDDDNSYGEGNHDDDADDDNDDADDDGDFVVDDNDDRTLHARRPKRNHSSSHRIENADSDSQSDPDEAADDQDAVSRSPDDSSPRQSPLPARTNGNAVDSDSDDQSAQPKRRRNRRANKIVIPEEMRDNELYFRRSSRARSAPHRYTESASSGGSDLDFNIDEADKPNEDDDDMDIDNANGVDDDDDYADRPTRSKRKSRTARQTSSARPRSRRKLSDDDDHDDADDAGSESGSDGDWRTGTSKRAAGRRSRKPSRHGPSKRQRTSDPDEDDAARSARVNSRGGHVNYFESDDGEFLASDQEGIAKKMAQYEEASNLPHIERILEYRLREGKSPATAGSVLYSDFKLEDVEFKVKWSSVSFRKCSWESWEVLRNLKGAKRVSNYIKSVELTRDSLSKEGVIPEEIEEARVLLEEYITSLRAHDIVDRVIAKRDNDKDETQTEYLVKWTNLSYRESTWELRSELTSDLDIKAVDDYMDRESFVWNTAGKKRFNPFGTKEDRPKFKRMTEQPDYLNGEGRTLRDYQLAGLNYLAFSWSKRNNVILADEMGLGKTLQTISFLGWLMYDRHIPGQFLVIVPLSTIAAWVREFARWLPEMNVVCYVGDSRSREMIRKYELYSEDKGVEKFHVLLTTPELVMLDLDHLSRIRYAVVAVDEAHRLKNETSSLHINLASLRSANRLLITGTPLQNSIRELWALLHFLNPDVFTDANAFEAQFSFTALREPESVSRLHKTLRPYIIRRQKGDVEKSLPKKTYSVLRVGMTQPQQQYYRCLLTRNFTKLNSSNKARGMGPTQSIRNLLMELKKCCNHPFLFPNYEDTSTTTTVNDLVRPSGKMILLDKLLRRLREKGHRVLIFSQMVRMLDILQDYCRMRQFPCQRLDGSIENEVRQRAVDHYNAPDSTDFIFLLSTRAGGLGINLATADTVIIFDSDWNPQNDLQAESRAHRIGQKRDVKVFRLLTAESVEEDILERAKRKRVLEHVVIHGVEGGHKAEGKEKDMAFKKEELSAILRFGAERLFARDHLTEAPSDEKAKEELAKSDGNYEAPTGEKPSEEEKADEKRVLAADDIDEILNRAPEDESTQVGAAQPSMGDSLLNAFKWADFKAEDMDDDDDNSAGNMEMAKKAASKVSAISKDADRAKKFDEIERDMLAREGDTEFWNRVIPEDAQEDAIANDVVLGTRRRKRPNMFNGETDEQHGKRRRVSRAGRPINGRIEVDGELTDKEQRSLLRSLRKFGDPALAKRILLDSGLDERMEEETASKMLTGCLQRAHLVVKEAQENRQNDGDPVYETGARNTKEAKAKQRRILFDVLGESGVDAVDLLKRCDDLQMMRRHIGGYAPDTTFRFKNPLKPPSYGNIRWKPSNDAMLLVGVCRHGLGNWVQMARDSQLGLSDKIGVSGNSLSKHGAPDSTKLMRRIVTLLRELEREIQSSVKSFSRSGSASAAKADGKHGEKKSKSKMSKRPPSSSKKRDGKKASGGVENGGKVVDMYRSKRLALKKSHIEKLKELRLLSKTNTGYEAKEKIKRTKECLLHIGKGVDAHRGRSEDVERNLWSYVHDVCRTSLPGDRLQAIYKRIINASDKDIDSPSGRK